MEYLRCLNILVDEANKNGDAHLAKLFCSYPAPSPAEWRQCLREVVERDEDPNSPHDCMGSYELMLNARGVPTALAVIASEWKARWDAAGLPVELMLGMMASFERSKT